MLKTKQIVIKDIADLTFETSESEWSNNILSNTTVAYEITIGSASNNQFLVDDASEPFTITTTPVEEGKINLLSPLTIQKHGDTPIRSLRAHRGNSYNPTVTIINVLELVEEYDLQTKLDQLEASIFWDDTYLK